MSNSFKQLRSFAPTNGECIDNMLYVACTDGQGRRSYICSPNSGYHSVETACSTTNITPSCPPSLTQGGRHNLVAMI